MARDHKMRFSVRHAARAGDYVGGQASYKPGFQLPMIYPSPKTASPKHGISFSYAEPNRHSSVATLRLPTLVAPPGLGITGLVEYGTKFPAPGTLEALNEVSTQYRNAEYLHMLNLDINMAGIAFPITRWRVTIGDRNYVGEYEGEDGSFTGVETYTIDPPMFMQPWSPHKISDGFQSEPMANSHIISSVEPKYLDTSPCSFSFSSSATAVSPALHGSTTQFPQTQPQEGCKQSTQDIGPHHEQISLNNAKDQFPVNKDIQHVPSSQFPCKPESVSVTPAMAQILTPDEFMQGLSTRDPDTATFYTPHSPLRSCVVERRRRTSSI